MSEKLTCPGCKSHTSAVRLAYFNGQPCPHCGLSNGAIEEILNVQRSMADKDLTERYRKLLIEVDILRTVNQRMRDQFHRIRDEVLRDDDD